MAYLSLPPPRMFPTRFAGTASFHPGLVAGLGADDLAVLAQQQQAELNAALAKVGEDLEKSMKKAVIQSSATQLAITTALNAIPVVGWAASAIASVAMSIGGSKYQAEAEKIMATTKNTLATEQAQSEARIADMTNAAFAAEKENGIKLALSGQPLNGMDGLYLGSMLSKAVKKVTKTVKKAADDVSDFMQEEIYDPVSGRSIKVEAQEASKKILAEGRKSLAAHEAKARELINSPAFRETLRRNIAAAVRQNPVVQKALASGVAQSASAGPSKAALAIPAVAVGAAILSSLLGD